MKKFVFIFILSYFWMSSVQAYPWTFFRESKSSGLLEWSAHISYFTKGQAVAFSSLKWHYYNPTVSVDLEYTYSFFEKFHYFRMSELAVIFPFISKDWKMSLGFRNVLWSEADRYWDYGLWQARYMLDAFRPVQIGIPGLYLDYEGKTSFLVLFSYFYLPDIIIYPRLEEGKVSSENPFFVEDFQKFYWDIDELKLFQINQLFKPVVAFQIRHSIEESNISFSYAYKPINQFQYSVLPKGIDLSETESSSLAIKGFNYNLSSHHLASIEGELVLGEGASLFASLFYENPDKPVRKKSWLSDELESHLTFSILAYFYEELGKHSKTLFTIGWTKTLEALSQQHISNTVMEDLEASFGRAFNWKHAVSSSIEYQNSELLFRFRANYALDNSFYVLALENYFYVSPHVKMYLSGDLIARLTDRKVKRASSSIGKYKDLSRLLIGVQYVF